MQSMAQREPGEAEEEPETVRCGMARTSAGERRGNRWTRNSRPRCRTSCGWFPREICGDLRSCRAWPTRISAGRRRPSSGIKAAVENAVRAQKRATLRVTSAPALLSEIRSSFRDGSVLSEEELIRRYASVEFLLVDDLGVERGTDFAVQSLYLIIDARYTAMRRTVFTSNLDVEEVAGRLGDRIASRICGMGTVLLLDGRDRRLEG